MIRQVYCVKKYGCDGGVNPGSLTGPPQTTSAQQPVGLTAAQPTNRYGRLPFLSTQHGQRPALLGHVETSRHRALGSVPY